MNRKLAHHEERLSQFQNEMAHALENAKRCGDRRQYDHVLRQYQVEFQQCVSSGWFNPPPPRFGLLARIHKIFSKSKSKK